MRSTTWVRLVAVVFALSLLLAACGGDDEANGGATGATNGDGTGETTGGGGAATGGGGAENEIVIQGFAFHPATITLSGPTEFTVTNEDTVAHTFTLDDESVDLEVDGGGSGTVTIDVSESIGFHCRFHPNMTGTVDVA